MSGQRAIDCPICGREIGATPHEPGTKWSPQQRWLVEKLHHIGVQHKLIANVVGGTEKAINGLIAEMHRSAAR